MNDTEYRRKKLIKDLVDSPLFEEVFDEIQLDISRGIMQAEDRDKREELYYESKAVKRVMGQLIAIANEIRMISEVPNAARR